MIDGTDGSGKATQTAMLVERCRNEGHSVETVSFPQYGEKSAAPVEAYLSGAYGTAEDVGPYRASVLYAIDRYAASREIQGWLDDGKVVIADRYAGSNMGHQGAKIADDAERERFYAWEEEFEFGLMGIPRPDLNLVLHVPAAISLDLIRGRAEGNKHGGADDLHENLAHLQAAERAFLEIAGRFDGFRLIECAPSGTLLSREEIHGLAWDAVLPRLPAAR